MKAYLVCNLTTGKYVEYGREVFSVIWTDNIKLAGYFYEDKAVELVEHLCEGNLDMNIYTIIPIWV